MTAEELDALEALVSGMSPAPWRFDTAEDLLVGARGADRPAIAALRNAAPSLIASARALESLRPLVDAARALHPTRLQHMTAYVGATEDIALACFALFPEET